MLHRPTGRWYVGRAMFIKERWRAHRRLAKLRPKTLFQNALSSLPADEFEWVVLQECTANMAVVLEAEWIKQKKSFTNGFNSTEGGELTPGDYESIRRKMSEAWKHRTDRPFLGKKHSAESINLIKEAAKNRGPEWRKLISIAATGRKLSEETRRKLRLLHAGTNRGSANPFFGRKHSEASLRLISAANLGRRRTGPDKESRIIALRSGGMTLKQIAKAIRVSKGTASRVLTERFGRTWVIEDVSTLLLRGKI